MKRENVDLNEKLRQERKHRARTKYVSMIRENVLINVTYRSPTLPLLYSIELKDIYDDYTQGNK